VTYVMPLAQILAHHRDALNRVVWLSIPTASAISFRARARVSSELASP